MKEELIEILETFKYPVFLQGSVSQAYPDSFFTIWNNETSDQNHYDNDAIAYVWDFDVNFYSNDPTLVNTVPVQVKSSLKAHGWIVSGKGRDVPSDEPSHTGRGLTALYLEIETKEVK